MHSRNITLKSILIFVDYIVFFKEFVESCIQNFLNNFRKAGKYRNGPVIIYVVFCSVLLTGTTLATLQLLGKIPSVNTKFRNKLRYGAIANLATLIKNG